jgi:HK97 family phage prohead protease
MERLMPLVKPRDKEKRKDFLERCMGDQTSVDDFPDRSQRFAVCNGLYNDRDKKEDNKMLLEEEKAYHKKPKKDKASVGKDKYDNPGEAGARAKEIGCTGIHTLDENGKTIFMPCKTHDEYMDAVSKMKKPMDEDNKPNEGKPYHDDDDKKKPKKKELQEDKDCMDGTCGCESTEKQVFFADIKTEQEGVFSGYASTFGNVDNGNDIVAKGAFTKSLAERPARKVKLLSQHKTDEPIGIFEDIFEDSKGLYVKGKLALGTQKGRETYELMKMGAIDGMSIGFRANPEKQTYNESKRTRTLNEVQLLEISLVTFPMNERAVIQSVKGEKSIREWETILREAGGLSRTEAKVGAKALMGALNHRDDDTKQLADLIYKVANILSNKQTNI